MKTFHPTIRYTLFIYKGLEIKMANVEADHTPLEQHSLDEKDSSEVQNTGGNQSSAPDGDEGEYPTGLRLVFVVVALILAIFLTSLDFVSFARSRGAQ
jgi:cytochrome b subunit of formate dehydrogenase